MINLKDADVVIRMIDAFDDYFPTVEIEKTEPVVGAIYECISKTNISFYDRRVDGSYKQVWLKPGDFFFVGACEKQERSDPKSGHPPVFIWVTTILFRGEIFEGVETHSEWWDHWYQKVT